MAIAKVGHTQANFAAMLWYNCNPSQRIGTVPWQEGYRLCDSSLRSTRKGALGLHEPMTLAELCDGDTLMATLSVGSAAACLLMERSLHHYSKRWLDFH